MNNVSPIIVLVLLTALWPTIPYSSTGLIEWKDANEKRNRLPRDYIVRYHASDIRDLCERTPIDFE